VILFLAVFCLGGSALPVSVRAFLTLNISTANWLAFVGSSSIPNAFSTICVASGSY